MLPIKQALNRLAFTISHTLIQQSVCCHIFYIIFMISFILKIKYYLKTNTTFQELWLKVILTNYSIYFATYVYKFTIKICIKQWNNKIGIVICSFCFKVLWSFLLKAFALYVRYGFNNLKKKIITNCHKSWFHHLIQQSGNVVSSKQFVWTSKYLKWQS